MNTPTLSFKQPILPVIVIQDVESALPLAEALIAGGLNAIEITFRTDAAAESIRRIRAALPGMQVGAGTVVKPDQAKAALDAGVMFGLAPGTNGEIVKMFQGAGVPFIPGVATPSEVEHALTLGCRCMKVFPAEALGGVKYLKAMAAPYASQGVTFCPTGGVNLGNMNDYLSLPSVSVLGGTWLATPAQIAESKWSEITDQVKAALAEASKGKS